MGKKSFVVLAGLVLAGVVALCVAPSVVYPKTVREVPNTSGTLLACVMVEPMWGLPGSVLTLFDHQSVQVRVQMRDAGTGHVLCDSILTEIEDCESDALLVKVTWLAPDRVTFVSRRDERLTFTAGEGER